MKILKFFKKKKSGSALFIFIMIFFGIFIIAFGSVYIVFLNVSKISNSADNLRAYYAAKAGVERAKYEAIKNNYNFIGRCDLNIYAETLYNDSTYSINCIDNNFYSVGTYSNSQIALKIDGINIMEECSQNYLNGSLCGGGKLFKADNGTSFVVSPPNCINEVSCDNDFNNIYFLFYHWDMDPPTFFGATNMDDGLDNIGVLDPQSRQNLEAARFCDEAMFNGYDDWYLPAINQFSYFSDKDVYYQYYGFDINQIYWSSTEFDPNLVSVFSNGKYDPEVKNRNDLVVRCIRNVP